MEGESELVSAFNLEYYRRLFIYIFSFRIYKFIIYKNYFGSNFVFFFLIEILYLIYYIKLI